jgi:hypothetical protein
MLIPVNGYDKKSLGLALVVAGLAIASGVIWREYLSLTWADFDPLLVFCWVFMLALAAWRFSVKRDVPLAVVAFIGGAMIETWGTRAGLWTYFTHEKPPLFILPAWPLAALATERIVRALDHGLRNVTMSRGPLRALHGTAFLAFSMLLWSWTAVGRSHPTTMFAYVLVAITCLSGRTPREDLLRLLAGSLLGWLLEYWGTTRLCWSYWDGKTPPLAAVLSHGFATVAFARGVAIGHSIVTRVGGRRADHRLARATVGRADAG